MKKKIVAGAVLIIVLAILAVGTAAYLVSEARATNVVTTGEIKVELTEYQKYTKDAADNELYPTTAVKVMPGGSLAKIPVVKNTGTASCWVGCTVTLEGSNGLVLATGAKLEDYVIISGLDNTVWEQENGKYYLKTPLAVGDEVKLFDSVSFTSAMGNEFQGQQFTITVVTEAVQSDNNPRSAVTSYEDLWNPNSEVAPANVPEI